MQTRDISQNSTSPLEKLTLHLRIQVLLKLSVDVKLMVQEQFFKDYSIPLPQNALTFLSHLPESKLIKVKLMYSYANTMAPAVRYHFQRSS